MGNPRFRYYLAGVVSAGTFVLYLSALWNDFLIWDDDDYVVNNFHIRSWNSAFFRWAFTAFHSNNWHPLTWLSHALDYSLWGLDPFGHHLTSVLLHAANTFLVVLMTMKLLEVVKERRAAEGTVFPGERDILMAAGTTGLLFGIHPLHVESVAWVAERKDVLCALFYLLSVLSYLKYRSNKSYRTYFLCLTFFILALLSKPMAVSLPFVLLILDWYPLRRMETREGIRRGLIEKAPFVLLSLASSIVTFIAQKLAVTYVAPDEIPFAGRLLVAAKSLMLYPAMIVRTDELSPFYPYPRNISVASPEYLAAVAFVLGVTVVCIAVVKRHRVFMAVWGYYLVTLLPVIGLVRVGKQAMADRYMYLPGLGPFLLIGTVVAFAWAKAGSLKQLAGAGKVGISVALTGMLLLMSFGTLKQIRVWGNSIDLWSHVISREPVRIPVAYLNRGLAFEEKGMTEEALKDFTAAISLDPSDFAAYMAYVNRGILFRKMGLMDRAFQDYNMAIILNPNQPSAYLNLGWMFSEAGEFERAIESYTRAIQLNPRYSDAYNNRGVAFFKMNRTAQAHTDYSEAISLNPFGFVAYRNRGLALGLLGRDTEAAEDFTRALSLNAEYAEAYKDRADLYERTGRRDLAAPDYRRACELGIETACYALEMGGNR